MERGCQSKETEECSEPSQSLGVADSGIFESTVGNQMFDVGL